MHKYCSSSQRKLLFTYVYVLPKHAMITGAPAENKLSFKHGSLFHDGHPVAAVTLTEALLKLLEGSSQESSVLVARNDKAFDAKHLHKAVLSCGLMDKFSELVVGFCDTLITFRELYPSRSCTQMSLASDLLHYSLNAHNAVDDVEVLQKLYSWFIDNTILLKHSFTLAWFQGYSAFLNRKNKNLQSLQPLIHAKAVRKGMTDKIATSGLTIAHLKLAFERSGLDGVANVPLEKFENRPRVTSNQRVIANFLQFFPGVY